jgi:hypothetical protein
MEKQTKKDLLGLLAFVIIIIVICAIVICGIIKINSVFTEMGRKEEIRHAAYRKEEARFPDIGDTVELNGQKIIILKKYFWASNRTYRVRMPDGNLTDVMGSELIDKEVLSNSPDN